MSQAENPINPDGDQKVDKTDKARVKEEELTLRKMNTNQYNSQVT